MTAAAGGTEQTADETLAETVEEVDAAESEAQTGTEGRKRSMECHRNLHL